MFDLLTTQLSETADRQVWPGRSSAVARRTAPAARRNQPGSAVPPRLTFSPLFRGLDFTKPSLDREIGSRIWPGLKAAYRVIPTPITTINIYARLCALLRRCLSMAKTFFHVFNL